MLLTEVLLLLFSMFGNLVRFVMMSTKKEKVKDNFHAGFWIFVSKVE